MSTHETLLLAYAALDRHDALMAAIDDTNKPSLALKQFHLEYISGFTAMMSTPWEPIDDNTNNGDRPMPQIEVTEVTRPMLEDFHAEAVRAGDTDMQVICNRALTGDKPAIDEVSEAVADIHAMAQ